MLIFNNNTSFEGLKHISPAHTFLKKKKKKSLFVSPFLYLE